MGTPAGAPGGQRVAALVSDVAPTAAGASVQAAEAGEPGDGTDPPTDPADPADPADPGAGPGPADRPGGPTTGAAPGEPARAAADDDDEADDPDEAWTPGEGHRHGDWTSGRPRSRWQDEPPLQAPAGVTALAGQVLTLNGQPVRGVTIVIDDHEATTDRTGRFLLPDLEPGQHELVIDGHTASRPGRAYGLFEAGVRVEAGGTNVLPYTIWLPKLDTAHTVRVASPTTSELVLTTPHIPGLEVRIPAGSRITDDDGQPVTELGITAIPVDRPPFPLPDNVAVPVYFTVQPGGAYLSKGAQVVYPNYWGELPRPRGTVWAYDPHGRGWHSYGAGAVTPDGRQMAPDPTTRLYAFTGAMFGGSPPPPGDGPKLGTLTAGVPPPDALVDRPTTVATGAGGDGPARLPECLERVRHHLDHDLLAGDAHRSGLPLPEHA